MYLDFGPTSFSRALNEIDRAKILSEFVSRRSNRDVMTGLALNNYSPIEITEFIANRPELILKYDGYNVKVMDRFKEKKNGALRLGEYLIKKDPELLTSYEQARLFDYLYLTGQREKCIKEDPSPGKNQ
jgi:hypothetical protein